VGVLKGLVAYSDLVWRVYSVHLFCTLAPARCSNSWSDISSGYYLTSRNNSSSQR
jgi:hypothetical protein